MSANKRYYWLKLHDDFFDSKRIKKLRKLGADFVIIYLKMQLVSIKKGGILEYTGLEDSVAEEIALDIDEDVDKVQLTLSYLQSCDLLIMNDANDLILPYVEQCTGSETASTQRSRECRDRQKALQCNTVATLLQQPCNVEKEIEKEIEIDKDINNAKKQKHKHGEYQNVLLTDEEFEKLKKEFPFDFEHRIENLSSYMASTGKSYKSHLATIRNWARRDTEKKTQEKKNNFNNFNQKDSDYYKNLQEKLIVR